MKKKNKKKKIKPDFLIGFESGDISPFAHIMAENVIDELDPESVDLHDFQPKLSLEDEMWDENENLNLRVRARLLDIADDFWETCKISWVKPEGLILTGSICLYNWSRQSDIDLHLIVDFKKIHKRTDFVQEYFDEKKNIWNNEHKGLNIFGFDVELYVQDVEDMPNKPIYDLYKNTWVRKPEEIELKPIGDKSNYIKSKVAQIGTIIEDLEALADQEDDSHKLEVINTLCVNLLHKIKNIRAQGLEDGEMGAGNIIYKALRRLGYLQRVWDLQTLIYNNLMSLEENKIFTKKLKTNFLV